MNPTGDEATTRFVVIYSTHPDRDGALLLGRALVEARLAACVNVIAGMTSVYRWEGRTETAEEAVLIVKTRAALAETTMAEIARLHPYDTPALLVLPVAAASAAYGAWLAAETAPL